MEVKFSWRENMPRPPVEAQVFGEEVERIAGTIDAATPAVVLDAARDPASPIHAAFEWRDDKAAENFRIYQARKYLGGIVIVRVDIKSGATTQRRAFYNVEQGGKRVYVNEARIASSTDLRRQVVERARAELEAYLRKFGDILADGPYIPRLREVLDAMRDELDQLATASTRRVGSRTGPKGKKDGPEHRAGA